MYLVSLGFHFCQHQHEKSQSLCRWFSHFYGTPHTFLVEECIPLKTIAKSLCQEFRGGGVVREDVSVAPHRDRARVFDVFCVSCGDASRRVCQVS